MRCSHLSPSPQLTQRIQRDNHPEPYRLRFIELGNEQYNHDFVAQVKAMEARANEVGAAGEVREAV